jgi:hypothetical protein
MEQHVHRVHLTEEHFHLARRFMVTNRLRSTRVAVQKMIEMVSEWEDEEGKESVSVRNSPVPERRS